MSPSMRGKNKDLEGDFDLDKVTKQFRASVSGKRLSGRPSVERLGSTKTQNAEGNRSLTSLLSESSEQSNASPQGHHAHAGLVKQVSAWLKHEKARRTARRAKRKAATNETPRDTDANGRVDTDEPIQIRPSLERRSSDSSEGSVALEHLAIILERTLSMKSTDGSPRNRRQSTSQKLASIMKRHSTAGSDTDYYDGGDALVPSCDVILDNSKTMAYGAGGTESEADADKGGSGQNIMKEKEAWASFKYEIVRIAHTLKLKGWRRVPLDQSSEIEVERLSGALTNAVYVVSPPKNLSSQGQKEGALPTPKNPPP
jgi:choline kinase